MLHSIRHTCGHECKHSIHLSKEDLSSLLIGLKNKACAECSEKCRMNGILANIKTHIDKLISSSEKLKHLGIATHVIDESWFKLSLNEESIFPGERSLESILGAVDCMLQR